MKLNQLIKMNKYMKINEYMNFLIENLYTEKIPVLGRWCHISMNHCNNKVIEKKIDFANNDNNY